MTILTSNPAIGQLLALVPIHVGDEIINLYPAITTKMPHQEKAHAYMVNRGALEDCTAHIDHRINTLARHMNYSTQVTGLLGSFDELQARYCREGRGIQILSWHDATGAPLPNAVTSAGDLKKLEDGLNVGDTRPADVTFAKIRQTIKLNSLYTLVNVIGSSKFIQEVKITYFIRLPVAHQTYNVRAGSPRSIYTYKGPSDIVSLSAEEYQNLIFTNNIEAVEVPFNLDKQKFTDSTALVNKRSAKAEIREAVHEAAWPFLCRRILERTCPGYSAQPETMIRAVKMDFIDENGISVTFCVSEFYDNFIAACRPFVTHKTWPCNSLPIFVNNLTSDIKDEVEAKHSDYNQGVTMSGISQLEHLGKVCEYAINAEKKLASLTKIIHKATALHTLHASSADNSSFASVAERTLTQYSDNEGGHHPSPYRSRNEPECFGCGGPHLWSDKYNDNNVICPNADKPGVRENAKVNFQAFQTRMHDRRRGGRGRRDDRHDDRRDTYRDDRRDTRSHDRHGDRHRSRSDDRQSTQALYGRSRRGRSPSRSRSRSRSRSPDDDRKPRARTTHNLSLVAVCLNAVPGNRKPLPIAIDGKLPCISILIGDDRRRCPMIWGITDSGAALNSGSAIFIFGIVKRYPQFVVDIFTSEDEEYAPILLSGVVSGDERKRIVTELPAVVVFKTPYLTRNGSTTTISIAVGSNVSVNLLLGIPFLKAVGAALSFVDDTVTCKHIKESFPITYKAPECRAPKPSPNPDTNDTPSSLFVHRREVFPRTFKNLAKAIMACKASTSIPPAAPPVKRAKFESPPITQAHPLSSKRSHAGVYSQIQDHAGIYSQIQTESDNDQLFSEPEE